MDGSFKLMVDSGRVARDATAGAITTREVGEMNKHERKMAAKAAREAATVVDAEPATEAAGDVVVPVADVAEAVAAAVTPAPSKEDLLAALVAEVAALRAENAARIAADAAKAAKVSEGNKAWQEKRVTLPLRVMDVLPVSPFERGSNRDVWYNFVKEHEGKTVQEVTDIAEQRAKDGDAVTYHKRGRRAGQAENTAEWLDWLTRSQAGCVYRMRRYTADEQRAAEAQQATDAEVAAANVAAILGS